MRQINQDEICVMGRDLNTPMVNLSLKINTNDLLTAMKYNLNKYPSTVKWQYVGMEDGVLLKYPATTDEKLGYDPRFR